MSGRRMFSLSEERRKIKFSCQAADVIASATKQSLYEKRLLRREACPACASAVGTGEPSRRAPRNDTQLRLFMNLGSYFVYSPENYVPFDFRLLTFL
jgi:hypothetical protein